MSDKTDAVLAKEKVLAVYPEAAMTLNGDVFSHRGIEGEYPGHGWTDAASRLPTAVPKEESKMDAQNTPEMQAAADRQFEDYIYENGPCPDSMAVGTSPVQEGVPANELVTKRNQLTEVPAGVAAMPAESTPETSGLPPRPKRRANYMYSPVETESYMDALETCISALNEKLRHGPCCRDPWCGGECSCSVCAPDLTIGSLEGVVASLKATNRTLARSYDRDVATIKNERDVAYGTLAMTVARLGGTESAAASPEPTPAMPADELIDTHKLGVCLRFASGESCIGCGDEANGVPLPERVEAELAASMPTQKAADPEELFPDFWAGFGKRMVAAGDSVEVIARTAWHAAKAGMEAR